MVIPPAMMIESARDTLRAENQKYIADQAKELHVAVGDKSQDFVDGYQLGIETARVMVAISAEVMTHQADPKNIL